MWRSSSSSSMNHEEIEEDEVQAMDTIEEDMFEGSVFSFDIGDGGGGDSVYVGVGKSDSSMDALSWTLKNLINGDSTMVYLIHVFPELHFIPSPLGRLPKNQVSPQQVAGYMAQERSKRRQLLQKFLNMCSASKIKVDTILVESDMVEKAILDLIPILNVNKLVLGTSKSSLRKMKGKKGNGIGEIVENASEFCEVKIICEGKEVTEELTAPILTPSLSPRGDIIGNNITKSLGSMEHHQPTANDNDSFSCMCFKSPRVM
ncbi:Adenine nucleotide alpha hydrolases-like superfamily protein [Euphorbia peplus]|nr:Adenine nucleotide alpha hydrolases-like superfamily protein [Euphorbia peplus]